MVGRTIVDISFRGETCRPVDNSKRHPQNKSREPGLLVRAALECLLLSEESLHLGRSITIEGSAHTGRISNESDGLQLIGQAASIDAAQPLLGNEGGAQYYGALYALY